MKFVRCREKQQVEDEKQAHTSMKHSGEHIRAVICVCRHGDRYSIKYVVIHRTPKQKLKFKVKSQSLISKIKPYCLYLSIQ